MIKESRNIKMERRINWAKVQAAEVEGILAGVKNWPEFAKEPFRKQLKALREEVRKLEGRVVFFKKLKEAK